MTRETLKQYIDNIIISHCGFEPTFFTAKPDAGQNMIVQKDILIDSLDAYEVLSKIEHKCGILVNDEIIFNPDLTYRDFIDIFWNEILREHRG